MSFKRNHALLIYPQGQGLTKKLIGIGFRLSGESEKNPNIEDTLIAAAIEGMAGDFRVLGILTDWFYLHYERVNVDRLIRALKNENNQRVNAYFAAIGNIFNKDIRYKKLKKIYRGEALNLSLGPGSSFLIKRNGEDERFVGSKLLVANGTLRVRLDDILSPQDLAKIHSDYYYRLLIGPSYRADMVSLFKQNPRLTASELAKQTYGSFATAWGVMKDMSLIQGQW